MVVDKESNVPNSLSVPSVASFVIKLKSKADISEIVDFAKKENLPLFILGAGTNIVPHNYIKAVVAILGSKGIEIYRNKLRVQAGEKWDDVVKISIKKGFFGLEALSGIPGTCGAAPIQNIGAYGTEISKFLDKVEVYNRKSKKIKFLSNKECRFGYRQSIFKRYPDKFIILSVTLKLSKKKSKTNQTRAVILKMRKQKIPNPNIIPNAGSYFINPIIKGQKIYAGKLIEEAGLKGAKICQVKISAQNALILTNPNRADFEEIMKAEKFIIKKVFQRFGILLEREPRIIG